MATPRTEPKSLKFTIRFAPGELERLQAEAGVGDLSRYLRRAALERSEQAERMLVWARSLRQLADLAHLRHGSTPKLRGEALATLEREARELAAELEQRAARMGGAP